MAALAWDPDGRTRTTAERSAERFANEFDADVLRAFGHYQRNATKTLRWTACTLCGASPEYVPSTGVCDRCDPPEGWRHHRPGTPVLFYDPPK
jgi:hypothetical protein